MEGDDLMEAAKDAINKVFGDTSVPVATTRERLEELESEIGTMLEALPED